MVENWSTCHALVTGLPDSVDENTIKQFISKIKPIYKFKLINEIYLDEEYFLNRAVVIFSNEITPTDFPADKKVFYKGSEIKFYQYLEDIQENEFYIYGLPLDISETTLSSILRPYRYKEIKIKPSISKKEMMAKITFSKKRDRDTAMIKCAKIPNTGYYFFPVMRKTAKINAKPLVSDNLKNDYEIIQKERKYYISSQQLQQYTSFAPPKADISNIQGDVQLLIHLMHGDNILANENNIGFLQKIGEYLRIRTLANLKADDFLSFNNVVVLASTVSISPSTVESFISTDLGRLTYDGRARNLPPTIIHAAIQAQNPKPSSAFILQLIKQMDSSQDKTVLASLLDFSTLSPSDVRSLVLDPGVTLNRFREPIITIAEHHEEVPQYLTFPLDTTKPLNGIFAYLKQRDHGNPAQTGAVAIEASSTLNGHACEIIEMNMASNFSTREVENQWIKFSFLHDEVALTAYTIQTHSDTRRGHLKSWDIQGSVDGAIWVNIDRVQNSSALLVRGAFFMQALPSQTPFYRHIRLHQSGLNSLNYNNLSLGHFEIFGSFREQD